MTDRTRCDILADMSMTTAALAMLRGRSLRLAYGTIEAARVRGEIREGRDAHHDLQAELREYDEREAFRASCAVGDSDVVSWSL